MTIGLEVFGKVSGDGMTRRLAGLVPLGCLLLTCCMGETVAVARQDAESSARPAAIATAAPQQTRPQPAAQLTGAPQASSHANQDTADVVQEGRLLLAAKSSKPEAKKSKSAPAAKRLDASKEAEEEEDEETADSSGKDSGGLRAQTIQTDFDQNVTATLKDVVLRGAVLSATVSLNFQGSKDKKESEFLGTSENGKDTHVLDYETGTTYAIKKLDGFTSGRLHQGQEEKTLRATFDAPPKNVKTVGITIYGIGTFDDVKLGGMSESNPKSKGSKTSGTPSDSAGSEAEEEEDEEDEEEEDEDEKSLTGKGQKASGGKGR
ncbi:MAG: hypothetical protein KatS3mg082_2036 [Nitrospiraceae bacterium]|nr:MAG: hypothetical protein KatS3mg082_2036 [Nitrospiraceae bacterium]